MSGSDVCVDSGVYGSLVDKVSQAAEDVRLRGKAAVPPSVDVVTVKRIAEVVERLGRILDTYASLVEHDAKRLRRIGDNQVERDQVAGRR